MTSRASPPNARSYAASSANGAVERHPGDQDRAPASPRIAEAWPIGTSVMAERVRSHDWSASPIGPIAGWSAELRAATMLVLDCGFPAALVWGDHLTTIHNDGFLPILGNKPDALGRSFRDIWAEAWSAMEPMVRRAYAGEPTFITDYPIAIDRSGQFEQAWFTFAYSPVRHADGRVAGMIDIVTETTAGVSAAQALQRNERYYRALLTAGTYSIYRMSADWRLMYQLDSQTLANTAEPIEDWVDKYIPEPDRPGVFAAIDHAIATKTLFELEHRVRLADGGIGWVFSRAVPLLGPEGEIVEWFGAGSDVTPRRTIAEALSASNATHRVTLEREVRERTAELETSRNLLRATMNASTDMIQVFEAVRDADGRIVDFRWVLNNRAAEARNGEVRGERLLERNPGVVAEGIFDCLKRVTETGVPEQDERHYVHEQFDGWFFQTVVKLGDGVATTTREITGWKSEQEELFHLREAAAQARLRESEERLRQYGDASQDILWMRDADTLQWEYLTPAFEAIYGISREAALSGENFGSWLAMIEPEDRDAARAGIERVRRGNRAMFEFRIRRPTDGAVRWLRETDFPMIDDAGRVARIGGIGHDITELKATEQALAAAEQRQRALLEGIPQLVWRAVDGGEWTWASPQWTAYTGQREEDSHDWGWIETLHPEDRDAARQAWSTALESGGFEVEYRIFHPHTDTYRWFTTRATPVRAADGTIVEWLGTSTEIDQLRSMHERQRILVAELQHRTRNLIAVVRSTADKTMRRAGSLSEFRDGFRHRLEALARVQGLLSRLEEHDRVTFDELIRTDLSAMGVFDDDADRVTLEGPRGVCLRSSTVQTLAMALHELATNATKYGALKQANGHLGIRWRFERQGDGDQPWLHIDWRESGVVMPKPDAIPTGTGQGRELIERALPYQLRAKTHYDLGADGVHCTISIPVSGSTLIGDDDD